MFWSPRLRVRDRVPKVAMEDPLTAYKVRPSHRLRRAMRDGGITLTSAPVSTRYRVLEARSIIKKRRLTVGPGMLVAASNWPGRFPTGSRVGYICVPCHQSGWYQQRLSRRGLGERRRPERPDRCPARRVWTTAWSCATSERSCSSSGELWGAATEAAVGVATSIIWSADCLELCDLGAKLLQLR